LSAPTIDAPTSLSLLQRLRQPSDRAAWNWFAHMYTPLLFYWSRRMGLQESDAADLVQEVFALLLRKLPEFRYEKGGSFRGWLRMVLLNKYREQRRRRDPLAEGGALDDLQGPAGDPPSDEDYRHEVINRALALLRPDFQPATWEAFWQTVALGRPGTEVAAELGLSANAVRIARCRVLHRLRQQLEGLLG
jgi:RNA polymerase sigma-70 factor (ECF subfamily)